MTGIRSAANRSGRGLVASHKWRQWLCCLLLFAAAVSCRAADSDSGQTPASRILRIDVHDTLQPERANIFVRGVEDANRTGYNAILIDLSTPGGLSSSADAMVSAMQHSKLPVVVWVSSPQTRVSGEGLRLLEAADLSLMHSGAFLTPLWTDRVHGFPPSVRNARSTQLLDQLRQGATAHGRDTSQLEELAFGTHWFTAQDAVETHVVDGVADRVPDVLRALAALPATARKGQAIAPTPQGTLVITSPINLQERLLLTLMNPNVCVLLLTLGMLLIYLEVNTPGAFVPGVAGILLAMLAMYALHLLPLNLVGVLLCLVASIMLLLEGRFPSHGLLAFAGVLFLVVGLGQLVDGPVPQLQVEWSIAWGAGIGFGGVTAALIVLGLRARQAKLKTGADAMLGWLAVAQTVLDPEGKVLVRGELWTARLTSQTSYVAAGERVKVLRADGRILEVAALPLGESA